MPSTNNRSPGLTYEFYKATFDTIKHELRQCQLNVQKLPESNKHGVTRLLPKVSGVPQVSELRPIILLNSD